MKTNDLLTTTSSGFRDYIRTAINTNSTADYTKLKKLFEEGLFEAKNFPDSNLDIFTFDWQTLERDRNWWWQLQALPFLNWYANSFSLQNEDERLRYFALCLEAINNWVRQAKSSQASPLVWHDHAAAFRVRNLTNWLLFCHDRNLSLASSPNADNLGSLIIEHLDWLQDDRHYSKHTNHGFDQAMISLTIAAMFSHSTFVDYRWCNRERLKGEVMFAFTDEGVHKENSPGYQKMMLARLKQLKSLAPLGEQDIVKLGERYIERAEYFLRCITLPNGYLPMIGDTRGNDKGLAYEQKSAVDVLEYIDSGYVIVRGRDGGGKQFFLLLKNMHASNYHRHDDDLMVYLYYDGEVVLGDGGLFNHQEKDIKRKLLRSHLSHSTPFLSNPPIRDLKKIPNSPKISILSHLEFYMTSTMFEKEIARTVSVDVSDSLIIRIKDTLLNGNSDEVWQNFFFEELKDVSVSEQSLEIKFKKYKLELELEDSSSLKMMRGKDCLTGYHSALISREYGQISPAMRIETSSSYTSIKFKN